MSQDPRRLVVMVGLPGSGKSTLARSIGRDLGAPVLDKDVIKSALLTGFHDSSRAGSMAYQMLPALADDLVGQGFSVVVDSPGYFEDFLLRMERVAQRRGARLRLVECLCLDETELRRRFARRAAGERLRSQEFTQLEDLREAYGDDQFPREGLPALVVDTTRPPSRNAFAKLKTYLRCGEGELLPSTIRRARVAVGAGVGV